MAAGTNVILVSSKDRFTQRCLIPVKLFDTLNVKIGDYVTLQTSEKIYVCRIYTTVQPFTCIYADGIVTSTSLNSLHLNQQSERIKVPDNVTPIKVSTYDTITVKVVYKDDNNIFSCDKTVYEDIIHRILSCYVVGEKLFVNCNGSSLADLFNIHSIMICKTFPENYAYGRLLKSSKVEIVDLLSTEQMCHIAEFQHVQLGGMDDVINILMLNLITNQSSRILITGPSGSGKSSVVKKFCSNIKCFFIFIDGFKSSDLTTDKCNTIHLQFSTYLKMFSSSKCILLIDHIDIIASYNFKQNSSVSMLISLIKNLTNLNVSVIATAQHKTNISSGVSSLFDREVNIGIPTFHQRKEIIQVLCPSLNWDINYETIAQMTPGFVGHDISSLIKAAVAIRKKDVTENPDLLSLTNEDFIKALAGMSPSILKTSKWNMKVKPVYWKDIGGMFSIKQKLQMCVEWPLRNPELFKKVDLPCPHGVLLFGPPGCCKTTLARGLASECNANFFAANPAQIYSSYVGESEKNITELFYHARLCAPSIIFLDELDSLVSQRKLDKKCQGVGEKVLSCLLNEMDGFGTKVQFQINLNMQKLLHSDKAFEDSDKKVNVELQSNDVIVVAATNRPDLIDDALLRPGRFDIILYVSPPNDMERESILLTLTEKMPVKSVDMKKIAAKTDLFSGADLKSLCNEAAMNALRHDMSASHITEENFHEALKKIKPSITRQQIEMYEKLSSKYGTVIK